MAPIRAVDRPVHRAAIWRLLRQSPVVALLGARQVGKTTLASMIAAARKVTHFFDLEDPAHLALFAEPAMALRRLRGLVIIDEVHYRPGIFQALRPLVDRRPLPARFLLLGSASPDLVSRSSESLAGRIAFHELGGFSLDEVPSASWRQLWLRGGFPRAYLAPSDESSFEWRRDFIRTFLERDLARLGVQLPTESLRRFWMMLAHWHGQRWNASEFGRSFGLSDTAIRAYLDALANTYVIRVLAPWHESIAKRQVRSPKVYVADAGLLHALLDIRTEEGLSVHPKVGASFEGFILDQVIAASRARPQECYYWATQQGAEHDLLIVRGRHRLGIEIKRTEAPAVTKSMRIALEDLRLDRLVVVHAGEQRFPLAERITAFPAADLGTRTAIRLLAAGPASR